MRAASSATASPAVPTSPLPDVELAAVKARAGAAYRNAKRKGAAPPPRPLTGAGRQGIKSLGEWVGGARVLRKVEIIEELTGVRRWVAVDRATQQPVLRVVSFDQLRNLCDRLGWQVETKPQRSRPSVLRGRSL